MDSAPVFNLSVKFDANIFIDDRYMAILRLCRFSCKMPIRANFGEFLGILTLKIVKLLFWLPKVRAETHFEILGVKIGSAVSSVALFKYYHYVKKVIGRSPKGYISPIWGEAPSNLNVTKFCTWFRFPNVIVCARLYLYHPNSFLGGGEADPKIGCSHLLEGWPYNS